MVQGRMIEDLHHRMYGSSLGVFRAIDHPANAGVHYGSRTHCARFDGHVQVAVEQAIVPHGSASVPQRDNFRVSCGIAIRDGAIKPAPHNFAIENNHRTYRDLPSFECALGRTQSFLHPEFIVFSNVAIG
jgi:hypothetical protein